MGGCLCRKNVLCMCVGVWALAVCSWPVLVVGFVPREPIVCLFVCLFVYFFVRSFVCSFV